MHKVPIIGSSEIAELDVNIDINRLDIKNAENNIKCDREERSFLENIESK